MGNNFLTGTVDPATLKVMGGAMQARESGQLKSGLIARAFAGMRYTVPLVLGRASAGFLHLRTTISTGRSISMSC
jgi:hypothetical protein